MPKGGKKRLKRVLGYHGAASSIGCQTDDLLRFHKNGGEKNALSRGFVGCVSAVARHAVDGFA
jgi:hypothetical protein